MKFRDVFSYSFSAIRLRKLRATLTILGVVIGIASVVALLSITQGLQTSISSQLQSGLATATLIVTPRGAPRSALGGFVGGQSGGFLGGQNPGGSDIQLSVGDAAIINSLSPDIENVVPVIQKLAYVKAGNRVFSANIVGVDFATYAEVFSTTFVAASGTIPQSSAAEDAIVVGSAVSNPWDNGTILVSANDNIDLIWTNSSARPPVNATYVGHVAAVLRPIGGFSFVGPSDSDVYVPIAQAQKFFGTDKSSMIIVKLTSSDQTVIETVSEVITDAFGGEVAIISATAALGTLTSVFSLLQLFLGGIAAISLLVAGIGIMNIMIVSLMERTREIGLLKALGIRGRSVLTIFLCESVIIGLIGAVIGIIAGWSLANVVGLVLGNGIGSSSGNGLGATTAGSFELVPVLSPMVLMGALAFGIGVSVFFALYPAWRASKLRPVDALRSE